MVPRLLQTLDRQWSKEREGSMRATRCQSKTAEQRLRRRDRARRAAQTVEQRDLSRQRRRIRQVAESPPGT